MHTLSMRQACFTYVALEEGVTADEGGIIKLFLNQLELHSDNVNGQLIQYCNLDLRKKTFNLFEIWAAKM